MSKVYFIQDKQTKNYVEYFEHYYGNRIPIVELCPTSAIMYYSEKEVSKAFNSIKKAFRSCKSKWLLPDITRLEVIEAEVQNVE